MAALYQYHKTFRYVRLLVNSNLSDVYTVTGVTFKYVTVCAVKISSRLKFHVRIMIMLGVIQNFVYLITIFGLWNGRTLSSELLVYHLFDSCVNYVNSSTHFSALPAKRLWNYLVTRDYLHDVFIRYIFRKQRSLSEVSSYVSKTNTSVFVVEKIAHDTRWCQVTWRPCRSHSGNLWQVTWPALIAKGCIG
jgi:hypothetical protein